MTSELKTAIKAVRIVGGQLIHAIGNNHQLSFKGTINLVTEMDSWAEKKIKKIFQEEFPDYGFLGEEGETITGEDSCRWIVDPIDGTTNYVHGYPLFAISIALEKDYEIVMGVVYNPLLDELFHAEKGKGAFLNGKPINVSDTNELRKSLLASGFPYDAWTNPKNNSSEWQRLLRKTISLRSDGVASLDLCHVAAGRLDGYWELNLEPWDMAAGSLIVKEAGGMVSSISGDPFSSYQRNILAANKGIYRALLVELNET